MNYSRILFLEQVRPPSLQYPPMLPQVSTEKNPTRLPQQIPPSSSRSFRLESPGGDFSPHAVSSDVLKHLDAEKMLRAQVTKTRARQQRMMEIDER